jgi:hypothetical protein
MSQNEIKNMDWRKWSVIIKRKKLFYSPACNILHLLLVSSFFFSHVLFEGRGGGDFFFVCVLGLDCCVRVENGRVITVRVILEWRLTKINGQNESGSIEEEDDVLNFEMASEVCWKRKLIFLLRSIRNLKFDWKWNCVTLAIVCFFFVRTIWMVWVESNERGEKKASLALLSYYLGAKMWNTIKKRIKKNQKEFRKCIKTNVTTNTFFFLSFGSVPFHFEKKKDNNTNESV